jgi:ubiquinone/menaquinone biosynthesis C-methylase UbiE
MGAGRRRVLVTVDGARAGRTGNGVTALRRPGRVGGVGRDVSQVDNAFADVRIARLYDAECPWSAQDDFYLALDLAAGSVLDVGCGTGTRLVRAREVGHPGPLVGLDPADGMLWVARGKSDRVQWVRGDAQTMDLGRRFDLITMTGHAFQVLLDDAAVREALRSFSRHLTARGLLAFETRNPAARAWQSWVRETSRQVIQAPDGEPWETWVDQPRTHEADLVTFTSIVRSLRTGQELTSRSTLRFIDPKHLRKLVEEAGFRMEGWFGDWDRSDVRRRRLPGDNPASGRLAACPAGCGVRLGPVLRQREAVGGRALGERCDHRRAGVRRC